jgi:hypothetical protein
MSSLGSGEQTFDKASPFKRLRYRHKDEPLVAGRTLVSKFLRQ